ncbi:MAG: acylphosphatase [Solirubrobacterales bacterium]
MSARAVAVGRVQGVFYRDTVRRAAVEHDVAGAAINRDDGTVSIVLEGERVGVEAVLAVAREGSSSALVESLEIEWTEPAGLTSFMVR